MRLATTRQESLTLLPFAVSDPVAKTDHTFSLILVHIVAVGGRPTHQLSDGNCELHALPASRMTHPARQAMMEKAIADRIRCRDWLLLHMVQGKPKAFTKEEYRQMAVTELGDISKATFDMGWVWAIEDAGRHDWYQPKPRRTETMQ
jgi:hypothetical protein